jgi:hypothetical protein
MQSQEYRELKEMIEAQGNTLKTILTSLKTCQSRCHVDNPPSRWRGLGRAIMAMIRF